jgi:hypothetical protein
MPTEGGRGDRTLLSQWELRLSKVANFKASNSGTCEDSITSGKTLCIGFICKIPLNFAI